jgi:hypothetical protein
MREHRWQPWCRPALKSDPKLNANLSGRLVEKMNRNVPMYQPRYFSADANAARHLRGPTSQDFSTGDGAPLGRRVQKREAIIDEIC